jgi:ATP-dependent Clp protease ATP-binding subunit ClpX
MADTPPDILAKMLGFGRLLDASTGKDGHRLTDDRLAEIKSREAELLELLSTTRSKNLQTILDYNNNGKPLDELALRIVCVVAHGQIAGSGRSDARAIVQAVAFDDDQQPVKARQLIFRLCVRGAFVVQDNYYGREQIILGEPLTDILRGPAAEPVFITRDAVSKAQAVLEAAKRKRPARILTAREIYNELSQYVAGQHELKMALAVAGRTTLLRREAMLRGNRGPLPPKANVLVIGPSGTGKTYSCQLLSKILGLPFASIDVSSVTASGYVGDDLSGVLYLLTQAASAMGVNPEQGGVIFLDEIDKISKTSYESATTVGVQYEALRLLDGGEVSYPSTGLNKWGGPGATMNTSALLIVASGAFSWLRDDWSGSKAGIGFAGESGGRLSDDRELLASKGGMVVELLNRFTALVRMQPLTAADIATILQNKFGPLSEYRAFLEAEGRTISVDDDAAIAIGKWSVEQGLMGRGPKAALERILREPLFTGQPTKVVITRELVNAALYPDTEAVHTLPSSGNSDAFSDGSGLTPQQGRLTFP